MNRMVNGFVITLVFLMSTGRVSTQSHPNVLFIFADDQRADALGCAGNSYILTPNIDRLAQNGIRFDNSYVMGGHHGAICAPSRAMLMSGKNLFHVYDKLNGVKTMPMHFSENGYITFATGKWHNEQEAFERSFQQGVSVFLGGMSDHNKVPVRNLVNGKLGEPEIKGFSTDIFAGAVIDFLNKYAQGDKARPFFCYAAFTAPHDPRSPGIGYIGMFDKAVPLPGNFMKAHPFAYDDMGVRDEHLAPWPRTPEIIQSSIADYYALIAHLDDKVGMIAETLKTLGLYENTIIVYAADNGLAIGSHGLLGKQNLYEHSVKVPLIIAGPGIPKSKVSNALVYLYDIFPTLCKACDLPQPPSVDGKNLFPIITGRAINVRNQLFTAYRNTIRAVRNNEWKLIRYPQINYIQLFNLKNDPLEINNLAYKSGYQTITKEMLTLLSVEIKNSGDTINLNPLEIKPSEFDFTKMKQQPDQWQPDYTLKKYFEK